MIPGGCGVGGQKEDVGEIVALLEQRGLEVEDRGDENNAVQGDTFFDEVACQPCGAGSAVTLSNKEKRRGPALVTCQVEADKLGDGFDVALQVPELLARFVIDGAAEAGSYRVNKDEVGVIQPRFRVVDQW